MEQVFTRGQWLLIGAVLIAAVIITIYGNTTTAPFVFDDYRAIVTNHDVQQGNLVKLWRQNGTRFIPYASFAANAHWSDAVAGFHLTNIAIHLLNAWLVGYLVLRLVEQHQVSKPLTWTPGPIPPPVILGIVAGLLFAVHPLATQAVTYIVQRLTSLAALMYLGTVVVYLEGHWRSNRKMVAVAWIVALVAMFTKEIAFTLPLALLLAQWLLVPPAKKSGWPVRLLFLLLLIVIPLTLYLQRGTVAPVPGPPVVVRESADAPLLSPRAYFFTQLNVVRTYLRLVVVPINQNIDYDYPSANNIPLLHTTASAALLAGLFALAVRCRARMPVMAFGILFFFVALAVESTFFPLEDTINEYRAYLPLVGIILGVVGSILYLPRRQAQGIAAALAALCIIFSVATHQRNHVWASELSLGEDTVQKSPRKARPFHSLGDAYWRAGDRENAQKAYEQAIQINPNYAPALNNLGLLEMERDVAAAAQYFERAIAAEPDLASAHANLGVAQSRLGQDAAALTSYHNALRLNPRLITAHYNAALLYLRQGQADPARSAIEKILAIDPEHQLARQLLNELE